MEKKLKNDKESQGGILIVDDSSLIRVRLRDLISDSGIEVNISEAADTVDAIEKFRNFRPRVVILDIQLSPGNGITLIEPFKSLNPGVCIIMLTNFPDEIYLRRCKSLGADYFFSKSTDTELVVEKCKTIYCS